MTIHEKIKEDIKEGMKARDEARLRSARNLLSAFTNELVAQKKKPDEMLEDEAALVVIGKSAKQRKDSIEQFKAGGREDLVAPEEEELAYLSAFLPEMMGEDEIKAIAEAKKSELGVEDKAKMGVLMGAVMKEVKGKADGGDVKKVVESLF